MTHNMSRRWRRPKRTPLCITAKNERIARALPVGNLQYYGQSHEDGVFVHKEVFEVRLKRIKCIYIRVAGAIYTSGLPEPPIFVNTDKYMRMGGFGGTPHMVTST